MKFQLRLTKQMVRDIRNVLTFTFTQFGPRKQEEYKMLIRDGLAAIAKDPHAPPAKRLPDLPDVYTFHIAHHRRRGRHLFLYRVLPSGYVDVARVLHDAMDIESHIPDRFRD